MAIYILMLAAQCLIQSVQVVLNAVAHARQRPEFALAFAWPQEPGKRLVDVFVWDAVQNLILVNAVLNSFNI
jgi:hypothetical protein